MFHTSLMSETLRFPQSKRSSYCCTQSRDFSSLRSLPKSEEQEYSTCGVCQHPGSLRRIPASRFIRQLTHWLCMPLFSSSANGCQHRLADTTHQTCELYTRVRQSHGFSLRRNGGFPVCLRKVIKQSDSPCLLQLRVQVVTMLVSE